MVDEVVLVVEVARVVLGPEAFNDAELDTGADDTVDDEMLVDDTMDDANDEARDADEEFVGTDELLDDPDNDDGLAVEFAEFVTVEEFVVMVIEDETVDELEFDTDDEEFAIELPKLVAVEELEEMLIEDETVDVLAFELILELDTEVVAVAEMDAVPDELLLIAIGLI